MFETLSERFSGVFRTLSGRGRITEANINDVMREVRTALLEADVHYEVAADFCKRVAEEAVGREVTTSLKPGQEFIGIVHEQLIRTMSGGDEETAGGEIMYVSPGPTIIMMCGLQGSGKTTTCGKLAAWLSKRGKSVMVTAADLQRPAAVEQLETVTRTVVEHYQGGGTIDFYSEPDKVAAYGEAVGVAVNVCRRARDAARKKNIDVLILDTAGRLHINDELMGELRAINAQLQPHQIFLVVDAMTGQDAVNSAKAFHEQLEVDGVILTKFDSDTRGGAALSVREVTGAPIRFIGVGEKLDAIEAFHPERMASRILGMGDVVSLVEKAQTEVSEEEALKLQEKIARGEMTMDDFLDQLRSLRRMGPMKQLLGLLPGVGSMLKDVQIDDKELNRLEGMVHSMTPWERANSRKMTQSRRRRIASGSGTNPKAVSQLVTQFEAISKVTKQMAGMGAMGKMKAMRDLSKGGDSAIPGMTGMPNLPGLGGKGSTKTNSRRTAFKSRGKKRR
ncbi:MAG: signal recognition particle protein [Phycisphaerales bacterium]|nr:signal recognition particle protein [Phycisphaerales bacterium]